MEKISPDAAADIIAQAIEKNLFSLYTMVAQLGQKKYHESESLKWVLAKPSWPNAIFDAKINLAEIEGVLASVLKEVTLGNAPGVWVVSPSTSPRNLGSYLERYEFVKRKTWSGMAIDLAAIDEAHSPARGLDIRPVEDPGSLEIWAKVITVGLFGRDPQDAVYFFDLFQNLYHQPEFQLFTGYLQGVPVGSAMLFLGAGVAGIYHISTLPEYRNQGIGTRMSLAPLLWAKQTGYGVGVLQASEMGEPVYRKIGFREYFRFDIYGWLGGR